MRLSDLRLYCFCFLSVLAGCAKPAQHISLQPKTQAAGLSASEQAFFQVLTTADADMREAVTAAFPQTSELYTLSSANKAEMTKLLKASSCDAKPWVKPGPLNSGEWTSEQTIDGTKDCPIHWRRQNHYSLTGKVWNFTSVFENKSEAFQKLSRITYFESQGEVEVIAPVKDSKRFWVRGSILYPVVRVQDAPDMRIQITIRHTFNGNSGEGTVSAVVDRAGVGRHILRVHWLEGAADKDYFIDNARYERKDFAETFGFLQLDEILDKSKDMR